MNSLASTGFGAFLGVGPAISWALGHDEQCGADEHQDDHELQRKPLARMQDSRQAQFLQDRLLRRRQVLQHAHQFGMADGKRHRDKQDNQGDPTQARHAREDEGAARKTSATAHAKCSSQSVSLLVRSLHPLHRYSFRLRREKTRARKVAKF
jgi:hypothetical protein